jgi:hypothetical protein
VKEIVEAQKADTKLKHFFKSNTVLDKGLELQLIEDESCICHKGWLVIPKPLQSPAVMWYHHYLQHPGHTRLEETTKAAIYWKGMRNTIRSKTKSCKTCQVNKKRTRKYEHLPPKIVISTPWEALCVDLVGLYTLKGKDGSSIDLSWECRMSACRPEGQNDRHILCRRQDGPHVGRHVADMSKKHVGRGPLMSADMSLADMSADMSSDMSVV